MPEKGTASPKSQHLEETLGPSPRQQPRHALRVLAVNPRAERGSVPLPREGGVAASSCAATAKKAGNRLGPRYQTVTLNSQSSPQPKTMVTPWEPCQFCVQPNNECLPLMNSFPGQIASDHLLCANPLGTEDASVCGPQKSLFLRSVLFPVQPTVSRSP